MKHLCVVVTCTVGSAFLAVACGSTNPAAECTGATQSQPLTVCSKAPTLRGIDVSHYQGTVDFAAVKGSGVTFAYAKAMEGTAAADSMFPANWPNMKKADVVRGAYHFFRASEDPTAQADAFVTALQNAGGLAVGDLPPALDLETADGQTNAVVVARASTWLTAVEAKLGIKPVIYAGNNMSSIVASNFLSYRLWVVEYQVTCPTMPGAWTSWTFWQDSQTGSVPGVSGAVDTDTFEGDLTALTALTFGAAPVDAGTDGSVPTKPAPDAGEPPSPGGPDAAPSSTTQANPCH